MQTATRPDYVTSPPPPPPQIPPIRQTPAANHQPMTTVQYVVFFLLMCIPLANLVLLCIWSFSDQVNINRKHLSQAILFLLLVAGIIALLIAIFGSLGFTQWRIPRFYN